MNRKIQIVVDHLSEFLLILQLINFFTIIIYDQKNVK
jgi:hypothetical protein